MKHHDFLPLSLKTAAFRHSMVVLGLMLLLTTPAYAAGEGVPEAGAAASTLSDQTDYYIQVSEEDGIPLLQAASPDSPLRVNVNIPKNTLLHITAEVHTEDGSVYGFTRYADLPGGYVLLTNAAKVTLSTGKKEAEKLQKAGGWGNEFVKVDGAGTPITFNTVSEEALAEAEQAEKEQQEAHASDASSEDTSDKVGGNAGEGGGLNSGNNTEATGANGGHAPAEASEENVAKATGTDGQGQGAEEKPGNAADEGQTDTSGKEALANDAVLQVNGAQGGEASKTGQRVRKSTFSFLSYLLGFLTPLLLEAGLAGMLLLSKKVRIRRKKQVDQELIPGQKGGKPTVRRKHSKLVFNFSRIGKKERRSS